MKNLQNHIGQFGFFFFSRQLLPRDREDQGPYVFQSDCFGSPVFNIRHGVVQDLKQKENPTLVKRSMMIEFGRSHTFKKSFHSQPGLVVDRGRDTFDTPTSSQSPIQYNPKAVVSKGGFVDYLWVHTPIPVFPMEYPRHIARRHLPDSRLGYSARLAI